MPDTGDLTIRILDIEVVSTGKNTGSPGPAEIWMALNGEWKCGEQSLDDQSLLWRPSGCRTALSGEGKAFRIRLIATSDGKAVLDHAGIPVFTSLQDPKCMKRTFVEANRCWKRQDEAGRMRAEACVRWILASFFEDRALEEADMKTRMDRVLQYIDAHLDRPIRLEEMSVLTGLHPHYFIRFFRLRTGRSPMRFITARRMEKARKLLEESDLSIAEIAERLGFAEGSYFARTFKKETGLTPLQYRKAHFARDPHCNLPARGV